jgi:hypothetical protein
MNITYSPNTPRFFQVLFMVLLRVIRANMIFWGGSLCLLYIGLVLEKRKKKPLRQCTYIAFAEILPLKVKLFGV